MSWQAGMPEAVAEQSVRWAKGSSLLANARVRRRAVEQAGPHGGLGARRRSGGSTTSGVHGVARARCTGWFWRRCCCCMPMQVGPGQPWGAKEVRQPLTPTLNNKRMMISKHKLGGAHGSRWPPRSK